MPAAAATAALLAVLTAALVRLGSADCQCLGARSATTPGRNLARNAALIAAAVTAGIGPDPLPLAPVRPVLLLAQLTVAVGLLCTWQLAAALTAEVHQ